MSVAGELLNVLTFRAGYNTAVVVSGTSMLGIAGGVVGVFMMLRKRALVTDALSHATLPGIVLAFLLASWAGAEARALAPLLVGASATGVLGLLCIQWISRGTRLEEDAAIGIVLSVFFGVGVVGLSYIQANVPAGAAGLSALIYGQTAAMRAHDAWLMGGVALASVSGVMLLLKESTLVCFNDGFARVMGWPVTLIDLAMMALVTLVTVVGLQAVGLILVVALLIIPPASARLWSDRLLIIVPLAGVLGGASAFLGAAVSAVTPDAPAGAVIVLVAGAVFTLSLVCAPRRGVLARTLRRTRRGLRVAGDHVLEMAFEESVRGEGTLAPSALHSHASMRGWSPLTRVLVPWLLRRRGLIRVERGALRLTEQGLLAGKRISRNHALWEQYLITHADVAANHVDWTVDQVEHVLSPRLV